MTADLSLNLIRTFVRLYEHRNVTETAAAMHVTQPTVSYSLQKLRRQFSDQLFVRGTRGLTPTVRAVALYEPLRASLIQIEQCVDSTKTFDAATSTSRLTVALSDIGELSLLPDILSTTATVAPLVRIVIEPLDIDEVEGQLVRGEIDAFIASPLIQSDRIARVPLFQEAYRGVVRVAHPRLRDGPVTREALRAERFVSVTGHSGHLPPVRAIHAQGLDDRVALELTRFSALPGILNKTDFLALVPNRVATVFASSDTLRLFDPPWQIDMIEVALYVRHQHARTPAQDWFIGTVKRALSTDRDDES